MNPPTLLQIAVKNNLGVYYFQHVLPKSLFESSANTPSSSIPSFGGMNMSNNNNNNNNGLDGLLI